MKKPKVSLDGAKIQAFFIQHVEKLLLVIVVGLAIFLVYKGFSVTGLQATQSPQGLLAASDNVRKFIDRADRWETEIANTRKVEMPILEMVGESQTPTDPAAYYLATAWSRPDFPKLSPRTDPKIFPPESLKVVGIIGPLAVHDDGAPDPLDIVPSEDDEGRPKTRPTKTKSKARPDILDPMAPMGTRPGARPARRPRPGESAGDPNILGAGGATEMMGSMYSGGSSALTALNPEAIQGFSAGQGAKAVPAQALVVMAVVPYEKQLEEFQAALANSLDYDPARDTPMYLLYLVERADVTDDPAADPATLAWTRLGVNAAKDEALRTWVGALGEVVDLRYLDPRLTHPAPPFLQRDPWELLTHPDVPLATLAVAEAEKLGPGGKPIKPVRTAIPKDEPTPDVPFFGPMGNSGSGSGFAPMPGSVGPAMGASMPNTSAMPGAGGVDGYGSTMTLEPPKYKLIRYTDMSAEIGRKYRYRMKIIIHDPNHPATGFTPPSAPSLAPDVQARLKKVDPRTYYVESEEWSAPSPVASLPDTNRYFAGGLSVVKGTDVASDKPPVPVTQPEAKTLTVVWDSAKVVDVPGEAAVYRGSVLNFTQEANVIHPVRRAVVPLGEYTFSTGAIVADMLGGEEIPVVNKSKESEPLRAPGALLIVDAAGYLHVRDEIDDVEGFRQFTVPEPPEPMAAGGAGAAAADIGGAGGILDMPMPAARPRRGGRGDVP